MHETINDEIKEIAKRIQKAVNPERIYLFGSYARGDARSDSDYDFYVIVDDAAGNPLLLIDEAYASIYDMDRKACDILIHSKSRFEERKNRLTLEHIIAKEGIVLYER